MKRVSREYKKSITELCEAQYNKVSKSDLLDEVGVWSEEIFRVEHVKEMGLLDDLLDAGKDVAQQQLGQLLQQLGQEGECGRFGVIVLCVV